jgi:uncharacterized beta-barrel protein YwiB (DUF1934 family)
VKTKLNFLFLKPFFGGSHREFARGRISHSRYSIDLVTLPARFWKWRLRGLSMISDLSGKTVEVEVSYDYSQQHPLLSSLSESNPAGFERD